MKMVKMYFALFAILVFLVGCNQSKEEMLTEGRDLMQSGNTNGAIVALLSALEKDPNYYEARYELAKAYIEVGKYEKAEKELQKVSRQNPANGELTVKMAEVYLATDRVDEAISSLRAHLAKHPEDVNALVLLGKAHGAENALADSLGAFRLALDVDPENVEAHFGSGRVLLAQENVEAAEEEFRRVVELDSKSKRSYYFLADIEKSKGNHAEALELWQRVVEIDPRDVTARFQVGLLQLGLENLDETAEHGQFLINKYPNRPEGPLLIGMAQFQRGEFEEAARSLARSLNLGPSVRGYFFLGLSYFRLDKFDLALNEFNKVLDIDPNFSMARLMLASTLLQQNHPADAANHARLAVEANPTSAFAHNVLGTALLSDGQVDSAMMEFDKALELDPKMSAVHMKKGLVDLGRGNLAEGETAMIEAVSAKPEAIGNRMILSGYYYRQGQPEKALQILDNGLRGSPQDALLFNHKAGIYLSLNKVENSINALKNAQDADPSAPVPYQNLASIYMQRGDFDKALAQFEALLEIEPDNLEVGLRRAAAMEYSKNIDLARRAFREAAEMGEPQAVLAYADFLARQKEEELALEVLQEKLEEMPDNPLLLEVTGRFLLQLSRSEEAKDVFEKLSRIDEDRGNAFFLAALLQNGESEKALKAAQDIVKNKPSKANGYILLSDVYLFQKNLDAALDALGQGAKNAEQGEALYLRKANIFERLGKYDEALSIFDQILENNPGSSHALYAKAVLLNFQGKRDQAEDLYVQSLKIDPKNIAAWNNLAYLQLENGADPRAGLQYAVRAFRLDPRNPSVLDTLGYALYQNEKYEDARKVLEAAVQRMPEHPTVKYHLALAYLKLNQDEKALGQLQLANAKESFPEKEDVEKLLNELQSN